MQPSFETARLRLDPRTLQDTASCMEMDRDPEVTRHVAGPWSSPSAHRALIESRTSARYPVGMGYWTIRWRSGAAAEFLGWVFLVPRPAFGDEAEIGWRLVRSVWGAGIATEAGRQVLDHATSTLRLRGVVADIEAANSRSIRVAEKLGLARGRLIEEVGRSSFEYRLRLPSLGVRQV
ncbi:GNAT family N-acetyltransferase [Roseateles sp. NT4]|uniref:GNAT family N-acetyltransferase n=1 Tax=Roseateles sp. NT4 TaxID=3453715 RepID=UPI003EEFB68E